MADVLNRTTKVLLLSVNTPDYPVESWIINPDLSAVVGLPNEEWVIEGDAVRAMTVPEKDAQLLAVVSARKFAAIDTRTRQLIAQGFEFPAASGQFFGLSAEAQRNIAELDHARDMAELTYPVAWNTLDDAGQLSIADSATAHNFFLAAMSAHRGHRDSGTAIKEQVRAATTIAEVDAVTDNR